MRWSGGKDSSLIIAGDETSIHYIHFQVLLIIALTNPYAFYCIWQQTWKDRVGKCSLNIVAVKVAAFSAYINMI